MSKQTHQAHVILATSEYSFITWQTESEYLCFESLTPTLLCMLISQVPLQSWTVLSLRPRWSGIFRSQRHAFILSIPWGPASQTLSGLRSLRCVSMHVSNSPALSPICCQVQWRDGQTAAACFLTVWSYVGVWRQRRTPAKGLRALQRPQGLDTRWALFAKRFIEPSCRVHAL